MIDHPGDHAFAMLRVLRRKQLKQATMLINDRGVISQNLHHLSGISIFVKSVTNVNIIPIVCHKQETSTH